MSKLKRLKSNKLGEDIYHQIVKINMIDKDLLKYNREA